MFLSLLALACSNGSGVSVGPPNLLLIDIDSLRFDRVGRVVSGASITPTIDALATRGTRFTRATSNSAWTMPALTSLLTGRFPRFAHSQRDHVSWIDARQRTLPEILGLYDYRTAVFYGSTIAGRFSPYDRGFETVWRSGSPDPLPPRPGELAAWAAQADGPWFALVHHIDLHTVLCLDDAGDFVQDCPQDTYDQMAQRGASSGDSLAGQRAAIDHYDGQLSAYDRMLASMLDDLERVADMTNTVVIVTSDHGEQLFERGHAIHGEPYEYNLHVPLVVFDPREPGGGREVSSLVQTVDLAPTVLDYAGIERDANMVGRSWRGAVEGRGGYEERTAFSITNSRTLSARTADLKLVACADIGCPPVEVVPEERAGTFELYDLAVDPTEEHDLYPTESARAATLERELLAWKELLIAETVPGARIPDAQRELLQKRGYWQHVSRPVGSAPDVSTPDGTAPGAGPGGQRAVGPRHRAGGGPRGRKRR